MAQRDVTQRDVTQRDVTQGDMAMGDKTTAGLARRRVRRHGRTVHNAPRAAPSFRVMQDRRGTSQAGEVSGEG